MANNEELDIVQTTEDGPPEMSAGVGGVELEEGDVGPFEYDDNAPNLVDEFEAHPDGEEALKKISALVKKNYDDAFDSTAEYRERKEKNWKIFIGNLPPKKPPFEDSANCHLPIMLENTTRNAFRAYSELFGDWSNVIGVAALGPHDQVMAQVMTLHGNWQLREQIIDFKRQQWRGMMTFFVVGDVTCHSYHDPELGNRHEILTIDEFFVPFTYTSTMPDYSDCPYRVRLFNAYKHQLEARRSEWSKIDELIDGPKPTFDSDPEQPMTESVARDQGIEPTDVDDSAPYTVLWWEGWLELPNQIDKTGKPRERFCKVICDYKSDKVFELVIHEMEDWQDRQRYDREMQEFEDHKQSMQLFEQQSMQLDEQIQQVHQGMSLAIDAPHLMDPAVMAQSEQQLSQLNEAKSSMLPPQPPDWVNPEDPEPMPQPVKMKPIHMFTHGVCIEPIVGNIGIGYGQMQADHNRAANTALSQFTDAATGGNLWNLILAGGAELEGGSKMDLGWGLIKRLTTYSGDDIRKNIFPLKPDPANPQLMEVVKLMQTSASSSMQSPDVLSGTPGKSGETFRGISARIEQATKQLSVSTRKYADFLEHILKKNALLNSIHLQEEEFFQVALVNDAPEWEIPEEYRRSMAPPKSKPGGATQSFMGQFAVGREMYKRNYHVEIRADLRFASQSQKIEEADELLGMAMKIPYLSQNPVFMYHAVRKALLARGMYDMLATLGPAPQPPPLPAPNPQQTQPNQQPAQQPPQTNGAPQQRPVAA